MPDPFDFDDTFGKAFKPNVKVTRSANELIEVALADSAISSLFSYTRAQDAFRRILFLHRADLFGPDIDFMIPHFHYSSTALKPASASESIVIENALETGASFLSENKSDLAALLEVVGIDDEQAARYFADVKDIAAYLLIEFLRHNPSLLKLANAPTFDYASMKAELKDFEGTVSLEPLAKLFGEGPDAADPVVVKKIEKLLLAAVSALGDNMQSIIENAHRVMPNLLLPFHLTSAALIQRILKASGSDFDDYGTVLEGLYLVGLIHNESTVFWCKNCSVENPGSEQRTGRIAPSKITKNRCLVCTKYQMYGSIYSIDEDLQDMLFSKDGLLAVYVGWLLSRQGLEFQVGLTTSKFENDFVLENAVISVKMFKAEKDELAVRSELDSALAQLAKHVEDLEANGKKIKRAFVVWNRHGPAPDVPSLMQKYGAFMNRHGVSIVGPDQIADQIESLAP